MSIPGGPVQSSRATIGNVLRQRALSTAHRLLAGSGRAEVTGYDLDPTRASVVTHGLSPAGDLVVVAPWDHGAPVTGHDESALRVRVDIIKEAPEAAVRITASSAHALGVLRWQSESDAETMMAEHRLDERLVAVARLPGFRVGLVELSELHLHESTGPVTLSLEAVLNVAGFPAVDQEWAAREVVGEVHTGNLLAHPKALALHTRPSSACASVRGRTYCVDVDSHGLTLMQVDDDVSIVTLLPFETEASTLADVDVLMARLRAEAMGLQTNLHH